ncbi:enoyl-CoA hydratase/isomerase family protein [Sphingomonas crocodyli]|uniref:Enoyl-CoA hydratase/isomerase family protein n=1 Tax=Sphingomonas crocodyli TaxID=1979270 RepID=A0A437M8V8_9SPHN|nr:enoyl-CoA hydratase/isomerase family protein [Sphingomonas crocodyli]RVT94016.1 enoyl-CoA hydratase/isomerase family protein [Sphingomonas crocodyli]
MTQALIIDQVGGIVRATLNRPEKLNALNMEIFDGLTKAVRDYAERDDQRVFLIRSTGRYFCAGADLVGGTQVPEGKSSTKVRHWYRKSMGPGMQTLYNEMESIEKPFVVAHHAPCVGGGLEMSLSCDFRLAAKSARYMFPEAKLGSIPASGGVSRFTRLVGPHWAKWIIMADQPIDADRALMIGLVHDVYPDDEFEDRVMAFCESLADKPPEMTAMAKVTIDLCADATPGRAHAIEMLGQSILQVGDEQAEMFAKMQAKLAKR